MQSMFMTLITAIHKNPTLPTKLSLFIVFFCIFITVSCYAFVVATYTNLVIVINTC